MTETNAALLARFSDHVRALLAKPPLTDTRLLELAASWEGLRPGQARMADALRLFVVTWDPLEWLAPRPEAVATTNAWPTEIVVYLPVWSLAETARRRDTTMAAVLTGLGGRAITTAAAHEDAVTSGRYAELAAHGEVPTLLSGNPGPALEKAVVTAESAEWERSALARLPISSSRRSAPSSWTGRWLSSPWQPFPGPAARPARAAGSSFPPTWPIPGTACARRTAKRRTR